MFSISSFFNQIKAKFHLLYQEICQWAISFIVFKKQLESINNSFLPLAVMILLMQIPALVFCPFGEGNIMNSFQEYLRYTIIIFTIFIILSYLYLKKIYTKFWYFTFFLALPFSTSFSLLSGNLSFLWMIYWLLLLVVVFLLLKIYNALGQNLLGIALALIISHYLQALTPSFPTVRQYFIYKNFLPTYLTLVLYLTVIYLIYIRSKENKIKQNALKTMGHWIAHDANTPLSNGLNIIDEIKGQIDRGDDKKALYYVDKLLQMNSQAIQDIQILLNSLSTDNVSDINDWKIYSAKSCIQDVIGNYYMTHEQKKRLKFLSNEAKDFHFIGSATLFRHVMFNLLKNAFKHAGANAEINISIQDRSIEFADNGYGIPAEIMENIFRKYNSSTGYGLGLSFCKEAMQKVNGNIDCISSANNGAKFVISFS